MYPDLFSSLPKHQGPPVGSHHSHRLTPMRQSESPTRAEVWSIGAPVNFTSGQWAGSTVRAELHEAQKADLGRKYAHVDRRPLDPPPAVLLKLFVVYYAGTDDEMGAEVENYDEVESLGLVCNVDLFPAHVFGSPDASGRTSCANSQSCDTHPSFSRCCDDPYSAPQNSSPTLHRHVMQRHLGHEYYESSKVTNALSGTTFVQPVHVDYQGKKALMFVFADLAVKIEGTFILRYSVFDLFSRGPGSDDILLQAQCFGGPFTVYSTKEFPGLHASTELTKQLARFGVRLNIREVERRRRKRENEGTANPDDL